MSESGQRQRVIKALKPLHAIPVENPMRPGTPDVNYADGWIELKWLRSWPKNEETLVRLEHFTPWQRRWLKKRFEASKTGAAWLLLQVGREWLLFTGRDAADYVGHTTKSGLYKVVRARWTSGLNEKEFITCLTRDWENWNGLPLVSGSSSRGGGRKKPKCKPRVGTALRRSSTDSTKGTSPEPTVSTSK